MDAVAAVLHLNSCTVFGTFRDDEHPGLYAVAGVIAIVSSLHTRQIRSNTIITRRNVAVLRRIPSWFFPHDGLQSRSRKTTTNKQVRRELSSATINFFSLDKKKYNPDGAG